MNEQKVGDEPRYSMAWSSNSIKDGERRLSPLGLFEATKRLNQSESDLRSERKLNANMLAELERVEPVLKNAMYETEYKKTYEELSVRLDSVRAVLKQARSESDG